MSAQYYNGNQPSYSAQKGLPEREYNFRYSMIKGRIAETLVEELFLSLGFEVFRYGMENTIPGIMPHLGVNSDVAQYIRRMPDLVICHPKTKKIHFIEVKFRANECFCYQDLNGDYPFGNGYIIVVSKKHIKCLSVQELKEGKNITAECKNYLGYRKDLDLNKDIVRKFCEFALLFFANVHDSQN